MTDRVEAVRVEEGPVLNLWKKNIGNKGAKNLMYTLRTTPYTTVDVSFNGLESEGAKFISQALLKTGSVATLILDCNYIQDEGVTYICEGLAVNSQLRHLSLSRNYIGPPGCQSLANVLSSRQPSQLQHLDLQWNNIRDEGVAVLAVALAVNSTLTHLNLARNFITDAGLASMADAIKANTSLKYLNLDFNEQSNTGDACVAAALSVNWTLQDLGNDIRLSLFANTIFKLGEERNFACEDNRAVLRAIAHRRDFFAMKYEFILLRELTLQGRLFFKMNRADYESLSARDATLRVYLYWSLDVTELIFCLIVSFLGGETLVSERS